MNFKFLIVIISKGVDSVGCVFMEVGIEDLNIWV